MSEFNDSDKIKFIEQYFDNNAALQAASSDVQTKYKEYVEEGCIEGWPIALKAKGYGCYGGNCVYDCNWEIAKDCMIKLTKLTDDEFAHNTLGYIYYYGRCNDGVPEYDKAFKHFSIGAASGVFESMYKLADMFADGKGVPKSPKAAANIIIGMYDENYDIFCNEQFDGKLADVALRMGDIYEYGKGVEIDFDKAYYYYLQAGYAIDTRMKHHDIYGDSRVKSRISECIERICAKLDDNYFAPMQIFDAPAVLGLMLSESNMLDISFGRKDEQAYISAARLADENMIKNILVTIPEIQYCELTNSVVTYPINVRGIRSKEFPINALITTIRNNEDTDEWEFCYRDQVLFAFTCDGFGYKR